MNKVPIRDAGGAAATAAVVIRVEETSASDRGGSELDAHSNSRQ